MRPVNQPTRLQNRISWSRCMPMAIIRPEPSVRIGQVPVRHPKRLIREVRSAEGGIALLANCGRVRLGF